MMGMFLVDTAVHHHQDAVGFRPLNCLLMANPLLQPQIRDLETHHVFHYLRDILGGAKYVYQVNFAFGSIGRIERGISLFSECLSKRLGEPE